MKVLKYSLEVENDQEILMPKGAEVLTVQMQGDLLKVWAMVDEEEPLILRRFKIVGTGHPILGYPVHFFYLGTIQELEGRLVWHIFCEYEPTS